MSNPNFMKNLNLLLETDSFLELNSEDKTLEKTIVITNPKFLYELKTWENLTTLSSSEVISELLYLCLVLKDENSFQNFWQEQKSLLELVLLS